MTASPHTDRSGEDVAFSGEQPHNHATRDIKPVGQCPGCDGFWGRTYSPRKAVQR